MSLDPSGAPVRACLLLAATLALASCRHVPHAPSGDTTVVAPPAAAAAPADDNLNAVLWMQRSVEYRAVAESLYRAAAERLDDALADPAWDALVPEERAAAGSFAGRPPAVILDIDETVLDNSAYQARLVVDGGEFSDPDWDAWVAERRAIAVPGAVAFTRAAAERGITVFYISNRRAESAGATLANLRSEGLPVQDDQVFLGQGHQVPGCAQAGSSGKTCRRQLVGRGHRVLMQFGDQIGDFAQPADRTAASLASIHGTNGGWFGERWWMLPNPTYGAWEPAQFGNDWSLPKGERRARKRDALRLDRSDIQ